MQGARLKRPRAGKCDRGGGGSQETGAPDEPVRAVSTTMAPSGSTETAKTLAGESLAPPICGGGGGGGGGGAGGAGRQLIADASALARRA